MRDARKNGRIRLPLLLSHTGYRPHTSPPQQPDRHQDGYTARKMAGLIQINAVRGNAATLIPAMREITGDQQ